MSAVTFLVSLFLLMPMPTVQWEGAGYETVQVHLAGKDELLSDCLKSGLTAEYRFELEVCDSNQFWFDFCGQVTEVRQRMTFNSITNQYAVTSDRHGDAPGPVTQKFTDRAAAEKRLQTISGLSLSSLDFSSAPAQSEAEQPALRVRVISVCKGEVNKTLARISYFLTLGMVRVSGFNTGWTEFVLEQIEPLYVTSESS